MKRVLGFCFGCLFLLVGCQQNGEVLPTAVLPPVEQILPTATATTEPPTTMPTSTAVAKEALTMPTITPAGQEAPQDEIGAATAPSLRIMAPVAGEDVFVGQSITIQGMITPVPEEEILVRVLAFGGDELLRETAVAAENGDWSVTATLPPQIIGSAQVMAQVADQPDAVAVQVNLQPPTADIGPHVTMDRPTNGGKVVAGYAVLFDGQVVQALEESVTMAIQSADCRDAWTSNSIVVPNGHWQGWSVLPPTAEAGAACAIAFTGERGTENAREIRMPITILDELDEQALSLQLGNVGEQLFLAGESAYFYGVAVQAPDNQVEVSLAPDNLETSNAPIAQGTANVNSFGYWEINLGIPPDTNSQQALLIVTMGEADDYREVRQVVFIQAVAVEEEQTSDD